MSPLKPVLIILNFKLKRHAYFYEDGTLSIEERGTVNASQFGFHARHSTIIGVDISPST
jgi:hypothetical protein